MQDFKDRTISGFQQMLKKRVDWMAEDCWPSQVEYWLGKLNDVIVSGNRLEVTKSLGIPRATVAAMVPIIADLRNLDMRDDIRVLLGVVLYKSGINKNLMTFEQKLSSEEYPLPDSIAQTLVTTAAA